jgi:hypothetical protein
MAEAGGDLTFAVFSALTHGRSSDVGAILEALAGGLNAMDGETALTLVEMTEAGLVGGTAGQQKWRELMRKQLIPYKSEFRREGIEEGRAQGEAAGRADAILQILGKRGIAVDDASRERIVSCADLDILGDWLDRSLTAAQVSDLFA